MGTQHVKIQNTIVELLPQGEVVMEKRFPQINRIADLAWEPRKIIFEVQCSPISLHEVKRRKKDYESCGYTLIWILHDKRFNRKWPTLAELYIRTGPSYFTNSRGIFYDQAEIFKGRRRLYRSAPVTVDLKKPPKKLEPPKERPRRKNIYLQLLDALVRRYSADNFETKQNNQ